jgi:hypothetical protein
LTGMSSRRRMMFVNEMIFPQTVAIRSVPVSNRVRATVGRCTTREH